MLDVNEFSDLKIGLASADSIRTWSNGEVKKPETINYRTLKPEKDGLFCEKIFGPTRDWECSCGKYKRVRFKGIICERCNVEVTRSKVRRERMGHIELAAPAVHIWYLRGTRSWLAYLLMGTQPKEELKAKQLEMVIYFGANLVVSVDVERRDADMEDLEDVIKRELGSIEADRQLSLQQRQEQLERDLAESEESHAKESEQAHQRLDKELAQAHQRLDKELAQAHQRLDKEHLKAQQRLQRELDKAQQRLQRELDRAQQKLERELERDQQKLEGELEEIGGRFDVERRALEWAREACAEPLVPQEVPDELRRPLLDRWSDYFTESQGAVVRLDRPDFDADMGRELAALEESRLKGLGPLQEGLAEARQRHEEKLAEAQQRHEEKLAGAGQRHEEKLAEAQQRHEEKLAGAGQRLDKELEKDQQRLERELDKEQQKLERELQKEQQRQQKATERDLEEINERGEAKRDSVERVWETFVDLFSRQIIDDEDLWSELVYRWGDYFDGGQGADAIARLIAALDFDDEEETLRNQINPPEGQRPLSAQRKQKAVKRLRILAAFNRRDAYGRRINDPRAMILDVVPVIPPELRPMVQLDGGRFATSDLNDLYRRVINRNNRLKRLLDLAAPEIIVNNEKRMLQEAVDALFDNGRRGRPVTGPGNRALKSLSDMLKGKQGRFRQNLLGKRVDYSGRSVIVVGPTLRFHQCGLPKIMALELFKPFVMKKLVDTELAPNIKSAKRMVERRRPQVWDVLGDVIREHPVLLNRAPTLHRLGIQAFEPVLVEGKAIQIHPLVCAAFNADFDGDQMAVHLPLSAEAQAEARVLMLSANNVLSPAHGRPLVSPSLDMIIGSHYLTMTVEGAPGSGRSFRSINEIRFAYETGDLSLHAPIDYRGAPDLLIAPANGSEARYEPTTAGRVMFNSALPEGFGYVNADIGQKEMGAIVDRLARGFRTAEVARSLDAIKDLCFEFATRSGLTISIDDVRTPRKKTEILDRYEKKADKIEQQFRRGIITDGERRQLEVEVWSEAIEEVTSRMKEGIESDPFNPINMMVGSGARGNMMQIRQIAGIRGLVANPRGDMIPRPIKSNFREGLKVLEYFIATPGARKGLVDTALRTADSGYLTRRLVDVAQEVIINSDDPFAVGGWVKGIWLEDVAPDTPNRRTYLETRLFSRVLADDVTLASGEKILAGTMVGDAELAALRDDPSVARVRVLSPLSDDSSSGITAASYGMSLATGKLIEQGEAVGVIAAQSIGEPGTQLTMRTFHTGGVAGAQDIAGGLPRVVELFEARTPKGKAVLARHAGVVRIRNEDSGERVVVIVENDGTEHDCRIGSEYRLEVRDGDDVEPGDALVEGPRDPKELLEIRGIDATQRYLVAEVQKVYRDQGVSIHDKHIELIVRQMTKRVAIGEPGDTDFLPDERVDKTVFEKTNREIVRAGGRPASGRREVMGITKASLATESWLSAASFQETTRVLTEAAIESRHDTLLGLKENIIIGKLIPAGTGVSRYREGFKTHAPDHTPMDYYSSADSGEEIADQLAQLLDARGDADSWDGAAVIDDAGAWGDAAVIDDAGAWGDADSDAGAGGDADILDYPSGSAAGPATEAG